VTKDRLTSSTPLNSLRNLPTEFYETWRWRNDTGELLELRSSSDYHQSHEQHWNVNITLTFATLRLKDVEMDPRMNTCVLVLR